jgi:hypothetical protein
MEPTYWEAQSPYMHGNLSIWSAFLIKILSSMARNMAFNQPILFSGGLYDTKDSHRSSLLHVFKNMGMFSDRETGATTWHDTIQNMQATGGFHDQFSFILSRAGNDKELASRVHNCILWLSMKSAPISDSSSVVKSFCNLLEMHLQYEENESDMILCIMTSMRGLKMEASRVI